MTQPDKFHDWTIDGVKIAKPTPEEQKQIEKIMKKKSKNKLPEPPENNLPSRGII